MSVARASIIMIATLVASRVLGWLRLSVIGATFGDSPQLDAFWAAFRIPNAIFDLLVAGALAAAFIPVFTGYLAREREDEGWHVASSVLNAVILLLVAFSAIMWVLAPVLVPIVVAPGFASNPTQLALTVDLTRLMLLSPIFMGLSDRAHLRLSADAAAARCVLDRDLGRGLPDALALRVPRPHRAHARHGAAGDPLDPLPHAPDGDPHDRPASPDREPALPVRTL